MAKSKVTSEPKENQESTVELDESIFELLSAENLLNGWVYSDAEPDLEVLLALVRVARAKIRYYQVKYNIQINKSDHFYVQDILGFARKQAAMDAKQAKHWRKQGYDFEKKLGLA